MSSAGRERQQARVRKGRASAVIADLHARGVRLVAVSGHDSSDWVLRAFSRAFGADPVLRVGRPVEVSSSGGRAGP